MPHENLAFATYDDGYFCYSCNQGSFKDRKFANNELIKLNTNADIKLPDEATELTSAFPVNILSWLYQYYIFEKEIRDNHIMYVPYEEFTLKSGVEYAGDSLIFPIIVDNAIVSYQRRFFPSKMFHSIGMHRHIFDTHSNTSKTVVLVEDFISAIRVGEVENCIWLQGTNLTPTLTSYIMKNYTTIKIWLDGDEPGQKAAQAAVKKIKRFAEREGLSRAFANREQRIIHNIVTENDPKAYSHNEIKEILSD